MDLHGLDRGRVEILEPQAMGVGCEPVGKGRLLTGGGPCRCGGKGCAGG
jgi:hypothetical protein